MDSAAVYRTKTQARQYFHTQVRETRFVSAKGSRQATQTAQAGSDGPLGRRAIRPRQSQTGQTAHAGQTGCGHQAAQNFANVPSCDNVSVNENSVNKRRARSTRNLSPQEARSVNRDAVVSPRHKFARHRGESVVFLVMSTPRRRERGGTSAAGVPG